MQKINVRDLIRFRKDNQVRELTIILAHRNHEKIGELTNVDSPSFHPQLTAADEFSFNVYKEKDGEKCQYWDLIVDHKVIYVKEYNEWFEISVEVDDSANVTMKKITATELPYAELGQVMLYNIDINTEEDIDRDDYVVTVFYNPENTKGSLLHRTMQKCPHYSIGHVDSTLWNIQRTFTADGTSVCDFWTSTVAQEIGCLFLFNSNTREINVYDMQTTCLDCGYRSEDTFTVCPDCGSTNIHFPYGEDTSIYIDKMNLADGLNLSSNASEIKNCFRVNGGDDLINATVSNINPNGSNYIYYFDDDTMADMPDELVDKINSYNAVYKDYYSTRVFNLDEDTVAAYNDVIKFIKTYYPSTTYSEIKSSYTGFKDISLIDYDVIDLQLYLTSSMMPAFESATKTAQTECDKLTNESMSPVAVSDMSKISLATTNNAVLAMAKAIIDTSLYKAEVEDASLSSQTWTGKIKLTSFSYTSKDENGDEIKDVAETKTLTIQIYDDRNEYINQLIKKALAKIDDETLGYQELYDIELDDDFKNALHKYSSSALNRYYSAFSTVLQVLVEQGSGTYNASPSSIYQLKYLPTYTRQGYIEEEIALREQQINTVTDLQHLLEDIIMETHNTLNFEKYIGDLWNTFVAYRREDTYSNDNYISDNLSNSELIAKAEELLLVAEKELVKSGEKKYTISSSILNLLMLRDEKDNLIFEPLLDDFTLGNFIKCKIDGKIYTMRLADITIDYGNLSSMSCTFTDTYRANSRNVNTVQEILSKAQNMTSSYGAVTKQASQGDSANNTLTNMEQEGLDSAKYNILNSQSSFILDEHGLLGRNWDDEASDYSPKQVRMNGTNLVFTKDSWETVELALGEQTYTLNGTTTTDYGIISKYLISGTIIGGNIYSSNYTTDSSGNITSGSHIDLTNGDLYLGKSFSYNSTQNTLNVTNGTITGGDIYSSNYTVDSSGNITLGTHIDLNNGKFEMQKGDKGFSYTGDYFTIEGATFRAGLIQSNNTSQTTINLDDGTFSFASGKLTYNGSTLSLAGTISVGGSSDFEGAINIYNSSNVLAGNINKDGLLLKNQDNDRCIKITNAAEIELDKYDETILGKIIPMANGIQPATGGDARGVMLCSTHDSSSKVVQGIGFGRLDTSGSYKDYAYLCTFENEWTQYQYPCHHFYGGLFISIVTGEGQEVNCAITEKNIPNIANFLGYMSYSSGSFNLYNSKGMRLSWQSDGNLVIYDASGNPLWASGTAS